MSVLLEVQGLVCCLTVLLLLLGCLGLSLDCAEQSVAQVADLVVRLIPLGLEQFVDQFVAHLVGRVVKQPVELVEKVIDLADRHVALGMVKPVVQLDDELVYPLTFLLK